MQKNKAKKQASGRILLSMAAIFLCLLIFWGGRFLYSWLTPIPYSGEGNSGNFSADSADWMSAVDDELRLSEITIPGTHDSTTEYIIFPYSYCCQDSSVPEQLQAGFRFLDLRCQTMEVSVTEAGNGAKETELVMHHGEGICKKQAGSGADPLFLSDVCAQAYEFLAEHPSECVIFLLSCDDNEYLAEYIAKEIEAHEEYWFTENVNPRMGDVRGKIVTMTRASSSATGYGIGLDFTSDQGAAPYASGTSSCGCDLFYQDCYQLGINDKWDAFCALLDDCPADTDTFALNHLSCASGFCQIPSPKENARKLNARLLQKDLLPGSYGIVIVDYGSQELAQKLYSTNFF